MPYCDGVLRVHAHLRQACETDATDTRLVPVVPTVPDGVMTSAAPHNLSVGGAGDKPPSHDDVALIAAGALPVELVCVN